MNYRLTARELNDIGRDCEPSALIFHEQLKELAGELLREVPTLRMSFCIGGSITAPSLMKRCRRRAPMRRPMSRSTIATSPI